MDIATYYMSSFLCGFSKALLERGIEGGYNFLSCLMGSETCSEMNRAIEHFEILKLVPNEKFFVTIIDPPMKGDKTSLDYYKQQLQLKVLMGVDMALEITPTDRLEDYEASMYEETLNIDTSLEQNTDLRQLDLQTAYLKKAVDVQRMAWIPTLSATANYNWISMSYGGVFDDFRWSPYSTVGLSLSLPIFQGGARHFRIKQAKKK